MHLAELRNHLLKTSLFSTPDERHAFVIGFGEVLCPWPARYFLSHEEKAPLRDEYHYYSAGRAVGFLALIAVIVIAKNLLWR